MLEESRVCGVGDILLGRLTVSTGDRSNERREGRGKPLKGLGVCGKCIKAVRKYSRSLGKRRR
jgi:hypothetical protein